MIVLHARMPKSSIVRRPVLPVLLLLCLAPLSRAALAAETKPPAAITALQQMRTMLRHDHAAIAELEQEPASDADARALKAARVASRARTFRLRADRLAKLASGARARFPAQAPTIDAIERDLRAWTLKPGVAALKKAPARPAATGEHVEAPAMSQLPLPSLRPSVPVSDRPIEEVRSRLAKLAATLEPEADPQVLPARTKKTAARTVARPPIKRRTVSPAAQLPSATIARPAAPPSPAASTSAPAATREELRGRLQYLMTRYKVKTEPFKYQSTSKQPASSVAARTVAGPRDLWSENRQLQDRLRQLQQEMRTPLESATSEESLQASRPAVVDAQASAAAETEKASLKGRLKSLLMEREGSPAPLHNPPAPEDELEGPSQTQVAQIVKEGDTGAIQLEEIDTLVTSLGAPPIGEAAATTATASPSAAESLTSTGIAASLESAAGVSVTTSSSAPAKTEKKVPGLAGVYQVITEDEKSLDRPDVPDEKGVHNFEGPDGNGESVYQIIRVLAEQLGLNIIIKGTISGRMILNVQEKSAWDVLESVLADQGLEYELLEGNVLKLYGHGIRPTVQKTYKFAADQNAREYEQLIQTLIFSTEDVTLPTDSAGSPVPVGIPGGLEIPALPGGAPGQVPGGAPGQQAGAQPGQPQPGGVPAQQGTPPPPPPPPGDAGGAPPLPAPPQ